MIGRQGSAIPIGYQLDDRRHGMTILVNDYPDAWIELCSVLAGFQVKLQEAIAGGQGKTKMTDRLERGLESKNWHQENFETTAVIRRTSMPKAPPIELEAASHEIDHFRAFDDGRRGLALEIEWNNKDTFFDRDLGNFQRLHSLGIISVGIIITRGAPLQDKLQECFLSEYTGNPDMATDWVTNKSSALKARIGKILNPQKRLETISRDAFAYKYGATTTHWGKLKERLDREMGAPCPLVLIGIGAERLIPN